MTASRFIDVESRSIISSTVSLRTAAIQLALLTTYHHFPRDAQTLTVAVSLPATDAHIPTHVAQMTAQADR